MSKSSDEEIEELEDRVETLESKIQRMLPSRREMLAGGAVAGAGLLGFGTGQATADGLNDGDTQWGSDSNRDDYVIDHVDANSADVANSVTAGSVSTDELSLSEPQSFTGDDADLQSRIDNAGANGHVRLPPGTWTIDNTVSLTGYSGLELAGSRKGTVLKASSNLTGPILKVVGENDITVDRLVLDVNGQGVNGVDALTVQNSIFSRLFCINGSGGGNTAINLGEDTSDTVRYGNWVSECWVSSGFGTGIGIDTKTQQYSRIENNQIYDVSNNGVKSTAENIQIIGNTITNPSKGIFIDGASSPGKVQVWSNVTNHVSDGVAIENGAEGVFVANHTANVVSNGVKIGGGSPNNVVRGLETENGADGVLLGGSGSTGNIIEDTYFNIFTSNTNNGAVREINSASGNVVRYNVEADGAGYALNSTANVKDNISI